MSKSEKDNTENIPEYESGSQETAFVFPDNKFLLFVNISGAIGSLLTFVQMCITFIYSDVELIGIWSYLTALSYFGLFLICMKLCGIGDGNNNDFYYLICSIYAISLNLFLVYTYSFSVNNIIEHGFDAFVRVNSFLELNINSIFAFTLFYFLTIYISCIYFTSQMPPRERQFFAIPIIFLIFWISWKLYAAGGLQGIYEDSFENFNAEVGIQISAITIITLLVFGLAFRNLNDANDKS